MKKAAVPIIVSVSLISFLASAILFRYVIWKPKQEANNPKIITPNVQSIKDDIHTDSSIMMDDSVLTSLVPLEDGETLLSIVSMDFDGDGLDDQVNAVRSALNPYVSLVVGLYNKKKNEYERVATIATKVTQVVTFAYTGLDLTGEHKTALTYQGYTENGNNVFQAFYLGRDSKGRYYQKTIADFEVDGTIFVQQIERYDSYQKSNSGVAGTAFPIWVYSTDTSERSNGDQLQTRYEWNAEEQKYVQAAQIRMTGNKLVAKELAKIQDGTEATFARFLDGLWYKTENKVGGVKYLFVNYSDKEIIFLQDESEEVYNWRTSRLRRNGIYITTTNQEIQNLQRRVDISLLGIDRVNLRIQDDLRMLINESNLWDGEYKKVNYNSALQDSGKKSLASEFIADLEKGPSWKSADGKSIFFSNGIYSVNSEVFEDVVVQDDNEWSEEDFVEEASFLSTNMDTGNYTTIDSEGKAFIQFRSRGQNVFFNGTYYVYYAPLPDPPQTSKSRKKQELPKFNKDSIIMVPYIVTPESTYSRDGATIILTRNESKE